MLVNNVKINAHWSVLIDFNTYRRQHLDSQTNFEKLLVGASIKSISTTHTKMCRVIKQTINTTVREKKLKKIKSKQRKIYVATKQIK